MILQRIVQQRVVVLREAGALNMQLEVVVEYLGVTPAAVIASDEGPLGEVPAEVVGDDPSLIVTRYGHGHKEQCKNGDEKPNCY